MTTTADTETPAIPTPRLSVEERWSLVSRVSENGKRFVASVIDVEVEALLAARSTALLDVIEARLLDSGHSDALGIVRRVRDEVLA